MANALQWVHPRLQAPSLLPLEAHQSAQSEGWAGGSQNPWGWKGHLEMAKAGSATAGHTRMYPGFECLQRRRLHDIPGLPVPVLCHPQCKELLPHVEVELLEF